MDSSEWSASAFSPELWASESEELDSALLSPNSSLGSDSGSPFDVITEETLFPSSSSITNTGSDQCWSFVVGAAHGVLPPLVPRVNHGTVPMRALQPQAVQLPGLPMASQVPQASIPPPRVDNDVLAYIGMLESCLGMRTPTAPVHYDLSSGRPVVLQRGMHHGAPADMALGGETAPRWNTACGTEQRTNIGPYTVANGVSGKTFVAASLHSAARGGHSLPVLPTLRARRANANSHKAKPKSKPKTKAKVPRTRPREELRFVEWLVKDDPHGVRDGTLSAQAMNPQSNGHGFHRGGKRMSGKSSEALRSFIRGEGLPKECEAYCRIRVWHDERGRRYYDCVCGGRKPVRDLCKIKEHALKHDRGEFTCPHCYREFPNNHLQLNSHLRIHKRRQPVNDIRMHDKV